VNFFFDSSALAKRYVEESRSDRVQEILSSASSLAISVLCISEIISALYRHRRERKLSQRQYWAAKEALSADVEDMNVVNLTDPVIARTIDILEKWPLRSSESLIHANSNYQDGEVSCSGLSFFRTGVMAR
jgi:predicted nucleic acid-binding protein